MIVNFWAKFLDLLPKRPKRVGTIETVVDATTYNVVLVGGGTIQATSLQTLTVGVKVYVQDGVIVGTAPALESIEIEV